MRGALPGILQACQATSSQSKPCIRRDDILYLFGYQIHGETCLACEVTKLGLDHVSQYSEPEKKNLIIGIHQSLDFVCIFDSAGLHPTARRLFGRRRGTLTVIAIRSMDTFNEGKGHVM